jgi:hypothetical protein
MNHIKRVVIFDEQKTNKVLLSQNNDIYRFETGINELANLTTDFV